MPLNLTEKQKLYAHEYLLTNDPIKAFVKAGYVNSVEEAKKSGAYTFPLRSKNVKEYIKALAYTLKVTPKEMLTTLDHKITGKNQPPVIYRDNSVYGMNIREYLIDFAHNPKIFPKDRLHAVELLIKFVEGFYDNKETKKPSEEVIIINGDV